MARELRGAPVAKAISDNMAIHAQALKTRGIIPKLAILRVGEKEDDLAYERAACKRMETVGVETEQIILPENVSRDELLNQIKRINEDKTIHGCLMFRPIMDATLEEEACQLLSPQKDVDGMTFGSHAAVYSGKGMGFAPCTAMACMELLRFYGYELSGKNIVVVGRSLVIGKPIAMLLLAANATVTICHTKTKNLPEITKMADILVVAAGCANTIDEKHVRSQQIVLDVGINIDNNGKMCGDVCSHAIEPIVSALTPVPGGVGSVTTAVLASHVIRAAELSVV